MLCGRVTATKVEQAAKDSIQQTIRVLGGHWSHKLGRRSTHLILPTTGGQKYDFAIDHSCHAVTPDWLVDSALAGGKTLHHTASVNMDLLRLELTCS